MRTPAHRVGPLLKQWREQRRLSQLDLAGEAGISTRHLSFVETGRAQPSREVLLLLSEVLEVPVRSRNELLTAAGYAPAYRETALDAPELTDVRRALEFVLRQQNPYPVIVVDRLWNVIMTNEAMGALLGRLLGAEAAQIAGPPNAMRLVFHPHGLRPAIVNWEATASALIQWLHRDVLRTGDADIRGLIDEVLSYPDVPRKWRMLNVEASTAPFLAIQFRKDNTEWRFFTILASLGTPYDVTLHELRIECFLPADAATDEALRRLQM
jgi:transcriptional regulator with XRE-family HTH domain